jgi:hypothetical protein
MFDFEEQQFLLFDDTPFLRPKPFARAGSQRWLQVAVNCAPELLLETLRPALQLDSNAEIIWRSPLISEGFREYRDTPALRKLGIWHLPHRSLASWWPDGGPKHDALCRISDGSFGMIEAKAHIGEVMSPPTQAVPSSRRLIEKSLNEARQHYAPHSRASWSSMGYQYANRLAWHYFLHVVNGLPARTIFLYFTHCVEMRGPLSAQEWQRPIRYLHRRLGLPDDFHPPGVHSVFLDVSSLSEFAEIPPAPEPVVSPLWRQRLIQSLTD